MVCGQSRTTWTKDTQPMVRETSRSIRLPSIGRCAGVPHHLGNAVRKTGKSRSINAVSPAADSPPRLMWGGGARYVTQPCEVIFAAFFVSKPGGFNRASGQRCASLSSTTFTHPTNAPDTRGRMTSMPAQEAVGKSRSVCARARKPNFSGGFYCCSFTCAQARCNGHADAMGATSRPCTSRSRQRARCTQAQGACLTRTFTQPRAYTP
jgi:hypothetical protein